MAIALAASLCGTAWAQDLSVLEKAYDWPVGTFFDADNQILIADIGHYESEQFTAQLFNKIISKKFPTFAVQISTINTNPINYL